MARVRIEVPVEQKAPPSEAKTSAAPHQAPVGGDVTTSPVKEGLTFKRILIGLAVLLLLIFVTNLLQDRNRLQQELENKGSSVESSEIVKILSKSVELPTDEEPEVRTIDDASKFTEQNPSLSDIKNGDMLLFFAKNKKVVVYRPSTKKAIVVVTLAQPTSTQNSSTNGAQ